MILLGRSTHARTEIAALGLCSFIVVLGGCASSQRITVAGEPGNPETCYTTIITDPIGPSDSSATTEEEALALQKDTAHRELERERSQEVPVHEEAFYADYYEITAQARVDAFEEAKAERVVDESFDGFSVYEARDSNGLLVARYELQQVQSQSESQAGWVVVQETFVKPPEVCARDAQEASEAASDSATAEAASDSATAEAASESPSAPAAGD